MTMREKIAEVFKRHHRDNCYPDAMDSEALAFADAVLDAMSDIDDVDFDAFHLGFKHHRGSVKDSIRAGLRAIIDAEKEPTE